MSLNIHSISTNSSNVRQDVFPIDQWRITTRKGIIMQSKCTCKGAEHQQRASVSPTIPPSITQQNQPTAQNLVEKDDDKEPLELCDVCRYHRILPQLHSMPDMLFNNNLLRLEHSSGVGIEFNASDALRLVEETKDPLRVAVADGWQSARADCSFAKSIVKPFDWTFTTSYRGTLLSAIKKSKPRSGTQEQQENSMNSRGTENSYNNSTIDGAKSNISEGTVEASASENTLISHELDNNDKLNLSIEDTDERIDINKLKVREEILFYDDLTLYEDELADHGTAQYSVKVRVMPNSLFILARYYLRVDGVLARINDTRIYHELSENFLLREYTNREAKLGTLNLPVSTVINASELMVHLPLVSSKYEKLILPKMR